MSPPVSLSRREYVQSLIRRISLRSYLSGLVAALLLGSGYLVYAQNGQTKAAVVTLVQVERRTIASTVKAAGKVTFASEQTLKFNQKGTVAKVNVKVGDRVTKGQILAELDKSSVIADVRSAQLSVGASALQLKQLRSDQQKSILDAQNALNEAQRQFAQAQSDLTVSKEKLPADLEAAKRTVGEKQKALDQAKADLEKQKSSELQSLASTAQSTLATSENLLDSFYDVLTRSTATRPAQGNYDLTINNLLYNDSGLAQSVKYAYLDAVNTAAAMHDHYGANLATERDPAVLVQALNDAHNLAKSVNALGENTYSMLQGATTDTTHFPVSALESLRSTVSSNRSKASDLLGTIETAQANLSAVSSDNGGIPSVTLQTKENAVTTAQNALTQAQDNLKLLQTQNPADLAAKQDSIQKMREDLESKKAALNSTDANTNINIQLKQNDVAQKATSVQKAAKALLDYQLTAPFDGVITHNDYKVGDNLLDTGDTESITLQNPDFVVVTIPLDQVDIVRVHKDLPATIVFDALPGQTFDGTISTIDSTPVVQSGVVSYNVLIQLPAPKDLTILSGMTTTVQIETSRKDNVLAVPNLTLQRTGRQTSVKMADGTSATVTTSVTNGSYTEILTGLKEGDNIQSVNISALQSSTNANAAQQLLRGTGGFGAGGGGAARIGVGTR